MANPQLPESCVQHQPKYNEGAWMDYTIAELGWFVHLLAKRSIHRKDQEKRNKDLVDAQNYLNMIQSQLNALKEEK